MVDQHRCGKSTVGRRFSLGNRGFSTSMLLYPRVQFESGWWFQTFLFSTIYGMSSFPLTNSYFSRWWNSTTNQEFVSCFVSLTIFWGNPLKPWNPEPDGQVDVAGFEDGGSLPSYKLGGAPPCMDMRHTGLWLIYYLISSYIRLYAIPIDITIFIGDIPVILLKSH